MSEVSAELRYQVVADDLIWRVIDGEAVVVHAPTSAYFGINPSGTALWNLLTPAPASTSELAGLLTVHFGCDTDAAFEQVAAFLDSAVEQGLVAITDTSDEAAPAASDSVAQATGPYEAPTIVRFGDLETLVLSGE